MAGGDGNEYDAAAIFWERDSAVSFFVFLFSVKSVRAHT